MLSQHNSTVFRAASCESSSDPVNVRWGRGQLAVEESPFLSCSFNSSFSFFPKDANQRVERVYEEWSGTSVVRLELILSRCPICTRFHHQLDTLWYDLYSYIHPSVTYMILKLGSVSTEDLFLKHLASFPY